MRVVVAAIMILSCDCLPCFAQQPPPPAPSLRSEAIPGGVLHYAGKGLAMDAAEDVSLPVANHLLRGYWVTGPENDPGKIRPPTIFADGLPLIVAENSLPMMQAVLTGGGHTYVRVAQGVDEDDPPYLWIVDVSGARVVVTRRIVGCVPTRQGVADGAYVLTCKVHGENRSVTHSFKDGAFR